MKPVTAGVSSNGNSANATGMNVLRKVQDRAHGEEGEQRYRVHAGLGGALSGTMNDLFG
jgi:hypothetical protein